MRTAVIGGGNVGTLMAAEFAHKGHEVTVYTSKPECWGRELRVYDAEENLLLRGRPSRVTGSMEEALEGAEIIWITMPAQLFPALGERMEPFVEAGQKIGVVPGSGGAEFSFQRLLRKGCTLFGFQRVHSIARIKQYGKSVYELGRKGELQVGAIPGTAVEGLCGDLEGLFDMPCIPLENYLSVTLTPSNPILHTTRLYSMFRNHRRGMVYPRNFLFYEEWTDGASGLLIACDRELQALCDRIPMDLGSVKSLREHYESRTVSEMTRKLKGIPAFQGLTSPMKRVENGWALDWQSRYFTADFPFGLKVIRDIAALFGVSAPTMDEVWNWYEKTAEGEPEVFELGITLEEFESLYGCHGESGRPG